MDKENRPIQFVSSEEYALTEAAEVSWGAFLATFKQEHYPRLFEPFGISFETALMLWSSNTLYNKLTDICERIDDE